MNIAICDDNQEHINIIESYILNQYMPDISTDAFYSGEELVKSYNEGYGNYDVIFLDMEMGRLNGIDTDSHIRLLIHAIDPKYDTDGLYFLDATWECKKDTGNENDFLNSYKFFMKTKNEMSKYDSNFIPDKKLDIDFDIIEQLKQNEMLSFVDLEFIKYNLLL